MFRILFVFLLLSSFIYAQSWNSNVDLNISAGDSERLDSFTDASGNHLIMQTSSQLKYYLHSATGTLVRSSTLDTHSESNLISAISGNGEELYVVYVKSGDVKSKRSTNAGSSWTSLTDVSMSYSTSDGIDVIVDDDNAYMVWSEKQGATSNYETHYRKISHDNSSWGSAKTVTDESGKEGGRPSISFASSNRITVGFTEIDDDEGTIYRREIYNGTWQSSSYIWNGMQGLLISDDSKTYLFTVENGDYQPGGSPPYSLNHVYANIGSSSFGNLTSLASYGTSLPADYERPSVTKTVNDDIHVVYRETYGDTYYERWNGSQFTDDVEIGDSGTNFKIAVNENDVYVTWTEDNTIYLKQRDDDPLKPTGFTSSWSSNHPRMDWDESGATDFDEYEIEKSDNGTTFSACTTLTSRTQTSFVDQSEIKYTPLGTKTYVYYRLYQVDLEANESATTSSLRFAVNAPESSVGIVSMAQQHIQVADYSLAANYPNPFNPETKISFALPEQSNVKLKVYDISGKEVADLLDGTESSGQFTVVFNGNSLPSGVYVYAMQATGLESGKTFKDVKRMLLVK